MRVRREHILLVCLCGLAIVAVCVYPLRDSIRIHYHKIAFHVKCSYVYNSLSHRWGNSLRATGVNWTWDFNSQEDDIAALVRLGYLVKREFTFTPPLSQQESQKFHFRIRPKFVLWWTFAENNSKLYVVALPDEMTTIATYITEFAKQRAAPDGPTIPSSELPPAGAVGNRSP